MLSDGLTYHPDFTSAHFPAILQVEDGTSFRFNIYTLAGVSTFFANLLSLPVSDVTEPRLIPLPSATAEGLALALTLLLDQLGLSKSRQRRSSSWPSRQCLEGFLDVVRAYDLSVAAEALLERSASSKFPTKDQTFERLVVAVAVDSPWIEHTQLLTLAHDIDTMDDWAHEQLRLHNHWEELYRLHFRWQKYVLGVNQSVLTTIEADDDLIDAWVDLLKRLPEVLFDEKKIAEASSIQESLPQHLMEVRRGCNL